MWDFIFWVIVYLGSGLVFLAVILIWFFVILVIFDFIVDIYRHYFPKEEDDPFNMKNFERETHRDVY